MDNRKILILKGSPREKGNSSILADRAAEGARSAGALVECFSLHALDIRPCDNCDTCRDSGGGCIVNDDMQMLYPKILDAAGILIASPIYWFSVSSQTKIFIDRWYGLNNRQMDVLSGKRFGILLVSEDSVIESGTMNAVRMFQDICRYIRADLVGIVHGQSLKAGEIRGQVQALDDAYQLGYRAAC